MDPPPTQPKDGHHWGIKRMEEGQIIKEDDRKMMEDDCGQEERREKTPRMVSPLRMVSEKRRVTRPPPPRNVGPQSDGGQVPDRAGEMCSVSTTGVTTCTGSTSTADGECEPSTNESVQQENRL